MRIDQPILTEHFALTKNQDRVATVMEKSWNFEIFWNFWKSHGISPKIDEGHGKVMEFDNRVLRVYKSPLLRGKRFNQPVLCSLCTVMELCHMAMEKSWNFVMEISWQP